MANGNTDFLHQVIGIRDQLQHFARQNVEPLGANLLESLERASRLCQQVMAEQLPSPPEAIEFVKSCGKIAENSCDGKIMTPYKNTPLPPWRLDSVQTPFSPSR